MQEGDPAMVVAWFAEGSVSHSVDTAFSVEQWIESRLGTII